MAKEKLVKQVLDKSEDFSKWYIDIIKKADLIDYAPIKGMMVIKPSGFAIWENIQQLLDKRLKKAGHMNAYFPLFIPESLLNKEAQHVEGFAPEVAWVTHGGKEKLEEKLAVRPTSESIICAMYSKWIRSWRDLPLLINQWCNVVRWEKVTRPFLRTTEFLWQEGHTAHASFEEAQEETLLILKIYKEFVEEELAIPVIAGEKTEAEKFAGAIKTYAIEALMSDGKALQAGTSHNLGQNFSKAFNIRFEDKNQKLEYVWQTSWGVSTRLIGALIMTHGDDSGLVFPPKVAPVQIVIIPIFKGNWKTDILPFSKEIENKLKDRNIRVLLDEREEYTPGWKFSDWEMRGVPMRTEIGPMDIKKKQLTVSRRDKRERFTITIENFFDNVESFLSDVQNTLYQKAKNFMEENTFQTEDYEEFKNIIEEKRGFVQAFWCGSEECEKKIKEETSATIRAIPLDQIYVKGKECILCKKKSDYFVYFAKSY
ncbi:MAG: proline--tRNA ligase [Acidobacteriota bacterium]